MIDVKEIITILCKCLHDAVDSPLTPEHFRIAKYDKTDDDVIDAFWTTLDKLSYFVLKELKDEFIDFDRFGVVTRTKFRMSYLQYPVLQFYGLSETTNDSGSRTLLLALAWLIARYDVLKNVVRLRLMNSPLGREFSKVEKEESNDADLSTVEKVVNNLLHKAHKLSSNLKAISELSMEKTRLTTRVHAASLTTSGLPHLSVSEMALVKKLVTNKTNDAKESKQLKEMEKAASMLDAYMKWIKKNHVFYTWMDTVIDELTKKETVETDETITELSKFIYLLKHRIRKKIKSFKNNNVSSLILPTSCPSKFLRAQKDSKEVQVSRASNIIEFSGNEKLDDIRSALKTELETLKSLLPNFHQI
ncbi:uncharacterized protein LOC106646766 [Copidosoma floridanum]|uniref:uncharacterized protein LOC106646766 n=1 Tax=Copidosoma floridanum TaxID=29053 RepID=UPI000C6FB137|nr:uncharacterized protein LOC106646766 [Copidosoma floridanum]